MKKLALILSLFVWMIANAVPKIGEPAPAFTLKNSDAQTVSLSDYKGKWVVLEWYNPECPFVQKHYQSNNMQSLQKTYVEKGIIWLQISSSAKGKQGFLDEARAKKEKSLAHSTGLLLDVDGKVGKDFGAKTTPHMFIVNPEGKLAYAGAIDSNSSADPSVIASSTNYVKEALESALSGKPIQTSSTKPYGCGVKY